MKREILLSAAESVAVDLAFEKYRTMRGQLEAKLQATIRMAIADTLAAKGLLDIPEDAQFNPIGPGKTMLVFEEQAKPEEKAQEAPKAEAPAACAPCEATS